MTQEQYLRAVHISERINALQKLKDEIADTTKHRLWYAEKRSGDYFPCNEYRMRAVSEILDKHDLMIRQEIDDEIDRLKKEIETL